MKIKSKIYIAITIGLIIMVGLHIFYIWGSSNFPAEPAIHSIYILSVYTSMVTYILSAETTLVEAIRKNLMYTLTVSIFSTVVYGVEVATFVQNYYYPYWYWQKDWPEFLLIILKTSLYSCLLSVLLTLVNHKVIFYKKKDC